MSDIYALIKRLRRPKLLIRAARCGLSEYRRERDLCRLVTHPTSSEAAMRQLLNEESSLEDIRLRGEVNYSVARHIEVLIALLAEARLVQQDMECNHL